MPGARGLRLAAPASGFSCNRESLSQHLQPGEGCVHVSVCQCVPVSLCVHMSVCIHLCVHVSVCQHVHVFLCVHVSVCVT